MFDHNKRIFIGEIDCTKFEEKFKIRSLTRYRKLWNDAQNNGHKFETFEDMEEFWKKDIRIKRSVLKYLFYIENKLGAEIVYFLLSEKECIDKFLKTVENNLSFVQINKEYTNADIKKINKTLKKNRVKEDIHLIPDKLTFSQKITFAKVLQYYSEYNSHKINFNLSFDINNLTQMNYLRNKIVHHDFILLKQEELMNILNLLKKYIALGYSKKFDFFIKESMTFLNDIYRNTI